MCYFHRICLQRILLPSSTSTLQIGSAHQSATILRKPFLSQEFFLSQELYASNVKIGELSRVGNLQAARKLFDKMTTKDVVSWNAIITAHWQNGLLQESENLFQIMPVKNIVSWNSMIAGCIENERIDEALDYFRAMPKKNTASYNAMISGFVKYGRIEEASRLFEEMLRKNVISYTAMIDGYMKIGEVDKARELFDQMQCKNSVSWNVMISGYVENGRFQEARELFEGMPESNKNVIVVTAMIMGYCKEGMVENARLLFERIQNKDLVSFNAMINGYAQNGAGEKALSLYSKMLGMGLQPDQATLVSVFTACSAFASLKEGRQTHVVVIRNGFVTNVSVCNALIMMYSKCGCILESESAFRQIHTPDIVSWNSIIAAFAQHGLYEKALNFFSQMTMNDFEPDWITFLSLLSACGHAGKVKESTDLFELMVKDYGIVPRSEHYACLVDILSRAGQLEKACKVIKFMPFKPDIGVWSSLLAACNMYLNVELAELAAKKIRDLDPHNSGPYVMLSNIYAAAGMWREVTRVRILMKDQQVKKQQAYSWMEIDNKMHCFLGGDISHPDTDKIYLEIKRVSLHLKSMVDIAEIVSS